MIPNYLFSLYWLLLFGSQYGGMVEFDIDHGLLDDGEARIDIIERIHLEPVTPEELAGGIRSIALVYDGTPISPPPVKTTIRREFPVVWKLFVISDESPIHADIRYHIVSEDGESDCLSSSDSEFSLPVRIRDTRQQYTNRTRDVEVLQGGCILELDIGSIRVAGTYRGRLHVDIFRE